MDDFYKSTHFSKSENERKSTSDKSRSVSTEKRAMMTTANVKRRNNLELPTNEKTKIDFLELPTQSYHCGNKDNLISHFSFNAKERVKLSRQSSEISKLLKCDRKLKSYEKSSHKSLASLCMSLQTFLNIYFPLVPCALSLTDLST